MSQELFYLRVLFGFQLLWLFLYINSALNARAARREREKQAKNKPRMI